MLGGSLGSRPAPAVSPSAAMTSASEHHFAICEFKMPSRRGGGGRWESWRGTSGGAAGRGLAELAWLVLRSGIRAPLNATGGKFENGWLPQGHRIGRELSQPSSASPLAKSAPKKVVTKRVVKGDGRGLVCSSSRYLTNDGRRSTRTAGKGFAGSSIRDSCRWSLFIQRRHEPNWTEQTGLQQGRRLVQAHVRLGDSFVLR